MQKHTPQSVCKLNCGWTDPRNLISTNTSMDALGFKIKKHGSQKDGNGIDSNGHLCECMQAYTSEMVVVVVLGRVSLSCTREI